jgi:hypothetical protein
VRVALGLKAHSGWAALVAISADGGVLEVIDRRRIELVEDRDAEWAGQPYHEADGQPEEQAREVVEHGIAEARRWAVDQVRAAAARLRDAGHEVAACAVLMPSPMPAWNIAEILAVHMRMHQAEGVLYPDALARAAKQCRLRLVAVPGKTLHAQASDVLATGLDALAARIAALGKSIGPPWGADQKNAALAAMMALAQPATDSRRAQR